MQCQQEGSLPQGLFGITKQRVKTIKKSLIEIGESDKIYVLEFSPN